MAIQNLSKVTALSAGDLVALFSSSAGSDVAATLATLVTWLQSQLTPASDYITQYYAPNATGWNAIVLPPTAGASMFLVITPTAGFAAGTITLPAQATLVDGQDLLVTCTQAVTTLTVAGNGAVAVNGAPTSLAANGFFNLRYDGVSKSWYRVG